MSFVCPETRSRDSAGRDDGKIVRLEDRNRGNRGRGRSSGNVGR
jgi:hypothetical protein